MKKAKTRYREQTERGGYLYPLETYRFHFDQREKILHRCAFPITGTRSWKSC